MIPSALLSAAHVFALAIGLPGLFLRGRALKAHDFPRAFAADGAWGIAALLWLATGLTRAFGPWDKGSAFYLHNTMFLVKMAMFAAILLLELYPMITLIRWRAKKAQEPEKIPLLLRINHAELVILCLMPFVAAMMARGIGY